MRVHLIDGTYELFRHHYGQGVRGERPSERAAARGVVASVLTMLEADASHIGIATDHVIESFRNDLWPGYKRGDDIPDALRCQFELVEEALMALGVVVWPMVELEADDALASAANVAAADPRVDQVLICTPDKDLGQCVVGDRVVQLDRRRGTVINESGVRQKFGVPPESIPDWLALVGDAADGFPGLKGWGKRSTAVVLGTYGHLQSIPSDGEAWDSSVLEVLPTAKRLAAELTGNRELAELFRELATLRFEPSVLAEGVERLRWLGPGPEFPTLAETLGDPGLARRAEVAADGR